MQHLGRRPEGKGRLCPCRLPFGRVRLSRIIELNHMFLRLCGYVNSFEFHRCRRTPGWNAYRFRFAPGISLPDSKHSSFTAWTTGYLILFDTHAFVPQRQCGAGTLPSQSGFCAISKHFTATPRIPRTSLQLQPASFNGSPGLSTGFYR